MCLRVRERVGVRENVRTNVRVRIFSRSLPEGSRYDRYILYTCIKYCYHSNIVTTAIKPTVRPEEWRKLC